MSRGPGIWQRQLLDRMAEGATVILTRTDQSHAEKNAIRRAANTLEAQGKLKIIAYKIDGLNRLAACPVGTEAPNQRAVTGLDGKVYRYSA